MTETNLAVSCRDVRKHFGEGEARIEALRGVDFSVLFGELSFLVGPSGCGKTTLISVVAGLLDRTAGDLAVLGTRMNGFSDTERVLFRRKNVGFVFQQYNLLPAFTAAENVAVPLLAAGVQRKEAVSRAKALLSRLGLGSRTDALPRTLSGGQQQRVALARGLRRADRRLGPCKRRGSHGAVGGERRAPRSGRHRRDPRQPGVPLRPQHRSHGRWEDRGSHPPERSLPPDQPAPPPGSPGVSSLS